MHIYTHYIYAACCGAAACEALAYPRPKICQRSDVYHEGAIAVCVLYSVQRSMLATTTIYASSLNCLIFELPDEYESILICFRVGEGSQSCSSQISHFGHPRIIVKFNQRRFCDSLHWARTGKRNDCLHMTHVCAGCAVCDCGRFGSEIIHCNSKMPSLGARLRDISANDAACHNACSWYTI